jgi:hypothetical protein
MINTKAQLLKQRINKALDDFTKGRAAMHVPPLETDVDMVLADCLDIIEEFLSTKNVE